MRCFVDLRQVRISVAILGLVSATACESTPRIDPNAPDVAAYMQAVGPRKIEIQKFLTRPEALAGGVDPDHLSVVLAVRDGMGDAVKALGTFHFELYTMRLASSDKLDQRLATWQSAVDSEKALRESWDRLSGYYRFPLELPAKLPPGKYVLSARLVSPLGETLFDEYPFTYPADK
ncbi:MAG: hypothetical protein U1D55_14555 [Phycisphaerae bacterium]